MVKHKMKVKKDMKNERSFGSYLSETGVPEKTIEDICSLSSKVSLENGYLYNPNASNVAFFYVQSGFVVEELILSDGTITSNYLYGSGSIIFNPMYLYGYSNKLKSTFPTYRTYCNVKLIQISSDSLDLLANHYPFIMEYVKKGLAEQAMIERECAVLMRLVDKRTSVIIALLNFGFFWKDEYISIPVKRLAMMLNTSRRYVISVIDDLVTKGVLLKNKKGFSIPEPNKVISMLPEDIIESIVSIPRCEVFNLNGCFIGKCIE